jgi:ribosome maturation factor RimP
MDVWGGGRPILFWCKLLERCVSELEASIEKIVVRELDLLGFELVKLESSVLGRKKILRLYIDHPDRRITLDDCVHVSKTIGFVLDGEDLIKDRYNLEVSSPGMNRPLTKPGHFRRFLGRSVIIAYREEGGVPRTVIGRIREATDEAVAISVEGREAHVAYVEITKANLHGEAWEVPKAQRPRKNKR